jgi:hypothetical protein
MQKVHCEGKALTETAPFDDVLQKVTSFHKLEDKIYKPDKHPM